MIKFIEMDPTVTIADQLNDKDDSPVILINTFVVAPGDAEELLVAWAEDAKVMKRQAGFISSQLHRGTAGSTVFLNYAVWESLGHFRDAFDNPEFRAALGKYPDSATTSPHLVRKVAVSDICVG